MSTLAELLALVKPPPVLLPSESMLPALPGDPDIDSVSRLGVSPRFYHWSMNPPHMLHPPPEGWQWAGDTHLWDEALSLDCIGWRPLLIGEVYHPGVDEFYSSSNLWMRENTGPGTASGYVIHKEHTYPMRTRRELP